ncbi:hypothetical protein ACFQY7_52385 [Actinomadura luteofluorescens]|uniref:hypothetical protein n=1 Tax=Actinomadura luteofluorescens TaxID=46163 RepID=UPI00362BC916
MAADLPQEPSPMTALALAVLVGSALRSLPVPSAAAVAAGGAAVTAFGWYAGPSALMALATLLVAGGFVTGALLRAVDLVRRNGAEDAGPPPAARHRGEAGTCPGRARRCSVRARHRTEHR